MSLYYEDEYVQLHHGRCEDGLRGMTARSVAAVITDPPYSDSTHENVRSNSGAAKRKGNRVLSGNLGFDSISLESLSSIMSEAGRVSSGWVVATLDYKHAFRFEAEPPEGLRMLRVGAWVKPNPMPQISGDRPGSGWEAIAFLHRTDVRPRWNGGGRSGVWNVASAQNVGHPTAKPISMVRDWVTLFTDAGDTVLDPFAGSGTTLRACADTGRKAIGYEIDERYCEIAALRLSQQAFDFTALEANA